MSLHKLSAGDGYTYLTRQVAAADDTHRGRGSLGDYYEQKGESPGVWLGSGLGSLAGDLPESLVAGTVTEEQMCALFGLGRHPNDRAIIRQLGRDGGRGVSRTRRPSSVTRTTSTSRVRSRPRWPCGIASSMRTVVRGGTRLSRTPSAHGCAASWAASGSARSTCATRWMGASSLATWPGSRGRRRCRWPAMT